MEVFQLLHSLGMQHSCALPNQRFIQLLHSLTVPIGEYRMTENPATFPLQCSFTPQLEGQGITLFIESDFSSVNFSGCPQNPISFIIPKILWQKAASTTLSRKQPLPLLVCFQPSCYQFLLVSEGNAQLIFLYPFYFILISRVV